MRFGIKICSSNLEFKGIVSSQFKFILNLTTNNHIIIGRVNYKFCSLCLHQIVGVVFFSKSLQAMSLTFQNLARYVL
ncbi:hypothetical protein Hanom_Chr16g01471871 [Helianthus anomalus]